MNRPHKRWSALLISALLTTNALAGNLYLLESLEWTSEFPDQFLAEYEGEEQSGTPQGRGVGYYYGTLEICDLVEADEVEESDPEILEGLCLEPSSEVAMYEGEWRGGVPWDGIIVQGESEAVVEGGVLNMDASEMGDDDD
jgi:hypothetical protein